MVAKRLIEWSDRQIVYSLCAKRERVISRTELQQQITIIIGDLEQDKLLPDFETVTQPEDYQPHGMLTRQIRFVIGGGKLCRFVIIMLRQSPSRWVLLRRDESLDSARRLWDYSSALSPPLFRLWRAVLSGRDLLRLLWSRRGGLIERRQSIQGLA